MHRIVSTWSCVNTDASVVSLDQSHLLWWLRSPCEHISLFLSVIWWLMQEEDVMSFSIEKWWEISLVLIMTEQWSESCTLTCVDQVTMNLDRDTEIQLLWWWQIIDANMTFATIYLKIILRFYLQHCLLVCLTKRLVTFCVDVL